VGAGKEMASALDHIEKTLTDAYRKELDQEENVWRSLAFFATAISFQIAAASQIAQLLAKPENKLGGVWWDTVAFICVVSLLVLVAIAFLAMSIAPAEFTYVADEPAWLAFARGLERHEQNIARAGGQFDSVRALKTALAEQVAEATHANRQINQRRAQYRTMAGLAVLASALFTMMLVVRVMLHYMPTVY